MNNKDVEFNLEIAKCKLGFSLSENLVNKIANATSTLFAPATAWLQGKQAQISCSYLPFYDKLAERKNENLQKLFVNVLSTLHEKELHEEIIPDQFEDTDNLLLIQDNASTTSNEEFLKLWAKFYTEEACKPGSITRKTIKVLETLDINIIKILENNIFPFCDKNGFYWGNVHGISDLLLLQDYGLIETNPICASSINLNESYNVKLNQDYILYCYPNFACSAIINAQMYRLTNCALEIKNNVNINSEITSEDAIKIIYEHINKSSVYWEVAQEFNLRIHLKKTIKENEMFVICDNDNNVVYPKNSPFKTYNEFYESAIANIEVV